VHSRTLAQPKAAPPVTSSFVFDASTGWYVVPATIKGVVVDPEGRVLLARNHRDEWELPGGWPTNDDADVADVLRREIAEEASLDVTVGELLHAELAVVGGHQVVIVAYRCSCEGTSIVQSEEHRELTWASRVDLEKLALIAPYSSAIARAFT
jgi:8-oxo-dGTP diphosphatase